MDRDEARRAFGEMVRRPDQDINLAEAALFIATHEDPGLDPSGYVSRLESMAAELSPRIDRTQSPLLIIGQINRYLFQEQGFRGDEEDYYDTRNSLLHQVMDRRIGIPITLSVVYLEVARRLDLPVFGVGFPGHFLVKYVTESDEIFIDPFNRGMVLTAHDLRLGIARVHADVERVVPHYLATVTKRQILARMLHNLKAVHVRARAYDRALDVINLLLILSPWSLDEIRDRGMVQIERGEYEDALVDLEVYLEYAQSPPDESAVRKNVKALRRLTGADPLV